MERVSVIIPAYNVGDCVGQAIDSVLTQDYPDIEVIVVDDGSTDHTADVVASFGERVVYVHQPNNGCAAARNRGILSSTGEHLLMLDADDRLLPGALARLAEPLRENPAAGVSYSGYVMVDEQGTERWRSSLDQPSGNILDRIVERNMVLIIAALIRRSVLARTGLFDPALGQMEDWDFLVRAAMCTDFAFVPMHLAAYRDRPGSKSKALAQRRRVARAILGKFDSYHQLGLVDGGTVKRSKVNMRRGLNELALQEAWSAYFRSDHPAALRLFLEVAVRSPRKIVSRGTCSAVARSVVRTLRRPGR